MTTQEIIDELMNEMEASRDIAGNIAQKLEKLTDTLKGVQMTKQKKTYSYTKSEIETIVAKILEKLNLMQKKQNKKA